jgi:HNH endonuclease.
VWPCPSTGSYIPSCPGWHIDHVIPLYRGGCDLGHNLQWLPVEIKLCHHDQPANKDCWEGEVYAP